MSALLKSGAGVMVRSFAPAAGERPAEIAADPRDLECALLRAQVDELRERLAAVEAAGAIAADAAREEGHGRGLKAAEAREADRVAAVREGIDAAVALWKTRLDALDGLAAALADAALAKIFAPHEDLREKVTRMLARQISELRRGSLVAVHVSRPDFADQDALETLAQRLSTEGTLLAIRLDPDLEAGACRIECTLEQIDLSVRTQWHQLSALLGEMAEDGRP